MAKRSSEGGDRAVEGGPIGLRVRGKHDNYYFKKQYKGVRYTIPLGRSLDQARMKVRLILNAMERGDFKESDFKEKSTNIIDFLENAVERLGRQKDHSKKSTDSYRNRVRQFASFLTDRNRNVSYLHQLHSGIGEEYIGWRRDQLVSRSGKACEDTARHPPAAVTIKDDVRRLRALFNMAVKAGIVDCNPFAEVTVDVKSNEKSEVPKHFNEKQVKALLEAAKEYDKSSDAAGKRSTFRGMMHDIVQFYVLTGLRKEELLYLPWEHVDLDWENSTGCMYIKPYRLQHLLKIKPFNDQIESVQELAAKKKPNEKLFSSRSQAENAIPKHYIKEYGNAIFTARTKQWNEQSCRLEVQVRTSWRQKATPGQVPFIQETRDIIERRWEAKQDGDAFVFPHPDRGFLRSDPLPEFKKLLRKAGLPADMYIHSLRHTFGFTLREKGVPLETIQGLMRHASIEETMIYAKYSSKEGAKHLQRMCGFGS